MAQGAYIFGCAGPRLTVDEARFFAESDPWGFILFARNVDTPDQLRRLTAELRAAVGRDAPVLIDQEGGRVQRLTQPFWRDWLPPLDQVRRAGPKAAARSMYLRARLIADELRRVGIDTNCAPLADVARTGTHPFLKNRCYGESAATVTEIARAVADGQAAGGVLPVLKHIPGHGRGKVDSHMGLPVVEADRDALNEDFAPFRALADLPMAMTAHIVFPAIDDRPVTESAPAIALIRDEIGFGGLLMSDDISMQALDGTIRTRSERSLTAGCDLVLHCNGDRAEMEAVAEAGAMTDAAQARAAAALAARGMPDGGDLHEAERELGQLLRGAAHA